MTSWNLQTDASLVLEAVGKCRKSSKNLRCAIVLQPVSYSLTLAPPLRQLLESMHATRIVRDSRSHLWRRTKDILKIPHFSTFICFFFLKQNKRRKEREREVENNKSKGRNRISSWCQSKCIAPLIFTFRLQRSWFNN